MHSPQDLTEALHEFVEKDNKESMKEAVEKALLDTQVRVDGLGGCFVCCLAGQMVACCLLVVWTA